MNIRDFDAYSETLPTPLRYVLALSIVIFALGLRFYGLPLQSGAQFLTFYPAVALSFYLSGLGPGIFALIVSAIAVYYTFFPPILSWAPRSESIISMIVFCISSCVIACIIIRMQTYRKRTIKYERELLQEQLKERDDRLALAVDGARLGVWRWDVLENRVSLSDQCCAYYGLSVKAQQMPYDNLLSQLHPDDRELVRNARAKSIETHSDFGVDYRVIWPDGSQHWLHALGRPYFSRNGIIQHMDGIVLDIADRKKIEDQLHDLNVSLEAKIVERTAQLTKANKALAELSRHDVLTGLHNRLAADERLRAEYARMKRTKDVYAVLMLDIDFFKRVNDSHGHVIGDQVLQILAQTLRASLREYDFVARFGGEEFLILLPSTGFEQACLVAEKIRAAVEATPHPLTGPVTVSIGVTVAFPDQHDEDTAVKEADDQLYEAKKTGRNRVAASKACTIG